MAGGEMTDAEPTDMESTDTEPMDMESPDTEAAEESSDATEDEHPGTLDSLIRSNQDSLFTTQYGEPHKGGIGVKAEGIVKFAADNNLNVSLGEARSYVAKHDENNNPNYHLDRFEL